MCLKDTLFNGYAKSSILYNRVLGFNMQNDKELKPKCSDCIHSTPTLKAIGYSSRLTQYHNITNSKKVIAYVCSNSKGNLFKCKYYIQDKSKINRNIDKSNNSKIEIGVLQKTKGDETKMVNRQEVVERPAQIQGKVESVDRKKSEEYDTEQYHIVIQPTTDEGKKYVEGSKTERFHSFIRISPRTIESSIVPLSGLDNFIQCVEAVLPQTKKMKTHQEVMDYLKGKEFIWVAKRLGKTFEGKESKEQYVPQQLIK
jgi:hypothetical protein